MPDTDNKWKWGTTIREEGWHAYRYRSTPEDEIDGFVKAFITGSMTEKQVSIFIYGQGVRFKMGEGYRDILFAPVEICPRENPKSNPT